MISGSVGIISPEESTTIVPKQTLFKQGLLVNTAGATHNWGDPPASLF